MRMAATSNKARPLGPSPLKGQSPQELGPGSGLWKNKDLSTLTPRMKIHPLVKL